MSYSFAIKADTKDDAVAKVDAELAKVVESQPTHEADRQAAQDAVESLIDVLEDPTESERISVSVSGSLSWRGPDTFTGASVNISACIEPKS